MARPAPTGVRPDSANDLLAVTHQAIDLSAIVAQLSAPELGAAASFVGTVRSPNRGKLVSHIDYEGYAEMIEAELALIAEEARRQCGAAPASLRVGVVHRLGRLLPGEASLAVVIAAAHRRAALDACSFVVEACKERLPVWKLEVTQDGAAEFVPGVSKAAPTL